MLTEVTLGMVLGALAWGFLVEPKVIDETDDLVSLPGLAPVWEGQKVAFISDIQVGMLFANTGTARRMVDRLVDEPPAAVLLGGDFVYSEDPDPASQISTVLDIVRPLTEAGIPTFAVIGNHDIEVEVADELERRMAGIGIEVLRNEAAALPPPGDPDGAPLHIVGLGSHVGDRDHPAQALDDVPDAQPRIVFMHNPRSFPELPPGTAPLAVAGHTHGGQVRVPFLPEWSYLSLRRDPDVPVDGWADDYGKPGNRLYVSRGVGFSLIPFRLNCPPELTTFTLASERAR